MLVYCLKLEINEIRCYEAQIEESEKGRQLPGVEPMLSGFRRSGAFSTTCAVYIEDLRVGGCPAVVAQWQSTGGSSQRCPGFDSRRLPAFFTFLYLRLITSNFIYFELEARYSQHFLWSMW